MQYLKLPPNNITISCMGLAPTTSPHRHRLLQDADQPPPVPIPQPRSASEAAAHIEDCDEAVPASEGGEGGGGSHRAPSAGAGAGGAELGGAAAAVVRHRGYLLHRGFDAGRHGAQPGGLDGKEGRQEEEEEVVGTAAGAEAPSAESRRRGLAQATARDPLCNPVTLYQVSKPLHLYPP